MERFWLGGLTRQCLYTARVWDRRGEVGFGFHPKEPGGSVNSVTESEPCDLWWLWLMESVVPDGGGFGEWSWVVIEGEGEGGVRMMAWWVAFVLYMAGVVELMLGVSSDCYYCVAMGRKVLALRHSHAR